MTSYEFLIAYLGLNDGDSMVRAILERNSSDCSNCPLRTLCQADDSDRSCADFVMAHIED